MDLKRDYRESFWTPGSAGTLTQLEGEATNDGHREITASPINGESTQLVVDSEAAQHVVDGNSTPRGASPLVSEQPAEPTSAELAPTELVGALGATGLAAAKPKGQKYKLGKAHTGR